MVSLRKERYQLYGSYDRGKSQIPKKRGVRRMRTTKRSGRTKRSSRKTVTGRKVNRHKRTKK
ncbi:MAG: hypothetical protein ACE5KJ_03055 [Candidatus Zixiibacteriota bacterium]